jgi:hypothetical protein
MHTSNRRRFITTAAVITAGAAASAMPVASVGAGSSANPGASPGPAVTAPSAASTAVKKPLAHHVFFWLKNPASTADRDKLVEGVKTLAKIETIREIHVGVLAATEKRDVVDTSWQVSELMFFSDLEGQRTYQDHPVHLDFIKNYGHLWEKVIVYDAMEV